MRQSSSSCSLPTLLRFQSIRNSQLRVSKGLEDGMDYFDSTESNFPKVLETRADYSHLELSRNAALNR